MAIPGLGFPASRLLPGTVPTASGCTRRCGGRLARPTSPCVLPSRRTRAPVRAPADGRSSPVLPSLHARTVTTGSAGGQPRRKRPTVSGRIGTSQEVSRPSDTAANGLSNGPWPYWSPASVHGSGTHTLRCPTPGHSTCPIPVRKQGSGIPCGIASSDIVGHCGNSSPAVNARWAQAWLLGQNRSDFVLGHESVAEIDYSGQWDVLDIAHSHDSADVRPWIAQTPGNCHSAETVNWMREVYRLRNR